MFHGGLFNNPWHSWHSPNQEDVQMVRQNNLFDDDMSSTSDPTDHLTSTAALTQPQMDTSSSSAHAQAQAQAPTSVIPSNLTLHAAGQHEALESEQQVNVWNLCDPSHHMKPEQMPTSHAATGKWVEPDTPLDLVPSAEATICVVPLPASKCCYEEELYEKEEIINKLQKKVQQQGKQNDSVTSLQFNLKQKESKLLGLHQALDVTLASSEQQIQKGKEQTIQQYEMQFEELRKQFEAEKEKELANIEQRYAQLRRPAPVVKHLDAKMGPLARPLPAHPQANTPSTPNLDAIKRIRKGRGISKANKCKFNSYKDNGLNPGSTLPKGHEEIGGEATFGTQDDQLNPPPVSAVIEVVTKNGGHFSIGTMPQSLRRTPQQRRQENYKLQLAKAMEPNFHHDFILAEVHRLFKEKLGIAQDIDFIMHEPANAADVHAYEYEDGPSPNMDNVVFDLMWNHSLPWNSFILNFLLHEFQTCSVQEAWPIRKDDDYIEEVLHEFLNCIIMMKLEAPDDDLCSWQWLQCLINSLGEHGMSSEESSVENGVENVLQVKKMEWQKNIGKELEIIDLQQILDKDIFCLQGTKPLPRKCAPDNPTSSQAPVTALPMALYNDKWILQLTEHQRESLKISKEPFPWMKIVAT
ncbi:hypothetical protein F5141DRAFT_1067340 [Pisolithus sp. B1]|nr:hypothetical protein F5141DRAFT_1067340 [Pisolithus sp. B1]